MVIGLWYTHDLNFGSLSWFWRCKEHPCPLSPQFGFWGMLEVLDWDLASLSWFWYGHWSLIHLWSKFWLSILILKVQRTSKSFRSSFGDFEDAGGSWLGFGILVFICIWSGTLLGPKLSVSSDKSSVSSDIFLVQLRKYAVSGGPGGFGQVGSAGIS